MANVKFLRGLQANLPLNSGAVDGTFYLTTDTHRLYVGNSSNACDLVSQAIITVNSISALPVSAAEGSFYYCKQEDALAVYTNNAYKQINPDDYCTGITYELDETSGVVTITPKVHFGAYNSSTHEYTANGLDFDGQAYEITGAGSTSVGVNASDQVVVTGVVYGVDQDSTSSGNTVQSVTIALTEDGVASQTKKFTLVKGNGIHFTSDDTNNSITITGPTAAEISNIETVGVAPVSSSGNGFVVSVGLAGGATVDNSSDPFDPLIKVGVNTANQTTVHFVDGTADLSNIVYTKDEIDASLTGLNAMVYMGTISNAAGIPTVASNVRIGDTYIISGAGGSGVSFGSGKVAYNGDMVIARGTESSTTHYITDSITWDIVSGSNADTKFKFVHETSTNEVVAKLVTDGASAEETGRITIAGDGTYITAAGVVGTGANSNQVAVTISHADVTCTPAQESTTVQTAGNTQDIDIISGITVDQKGHVSAYNVKRYTVVDTTLDNETTFNDGSGNDPQAGTGFKTSVSASSNVATVTNLMQIADTANNIAAANDSFSIGSSTLTVTSNNNAISVNLEWGTFQK